MLKISPLAPECFPEVKPVSGLSLTTLCSEERYKGRNDVLIALLGEGATSAAVFTRSLTPGAPVIWSREVHAQNNARAMIVSAGNANVCTGKQGQTNTQLMAEATAKLGELKAGQVFVSSTGVIGEQLDIERILGSFPAQLDPDFEHQDWFAAASAILTTDTFAKASSVSIELSGETITISGIAKGSGMVEPNMATMLSYIFTDASIESDVLQAMLNKAVDKSFNCITVDSDTSTSDTCLVFATGRAGPPISVIDSIDGDLFYIALEMLMTDLAQQIIRDGEGAQKFITVNVCGAQSDHAAKLIAKSIANSPLVKTAMAGEDANWGRIVMAVGKAGQAIKFEALRVSIGGVVIAEGDGPVARYDESLVQAHIEGLYINIDVDVGLEEKGHATVWTCDLTHGYIEINADYRS